MCFLSFLLVYLLLFNIKNKHKDIHTYIHVLYCKYFLNLFFFCIVLYCIVLYNSLTLSISVVQIVTDICTHEENELETNLKLKLVI